MPKAQESPPGFCCLVFFIAVQSMDSGDAAPSSSMGLDSDNQDAAVNDSAMSQQQEACTSNGTHVHPDPQQHQQAAANGGEQQQDDAQQRLHAAAAALGSNGQTMPDQPETLVYESRVLRTTEDLSTAHAVVADFGNACWTHKHFADNIQHAAIQVSGVMSVGCWIPPPDPP